MPYVYLTHAQLQALQDVWNQAERVDWTAYDACRVAILAVDATPDASDEKVVAER